jgi:hypothetical protein
MTQYWLTPLTNRQPLILGEQRIRCSEDAEFLLFLAELKNVHSKFLPMFKSRLLLNDDEGICGDGLQEIDLSMPGEIVFDGVQYSLSHCAESFVERLIHPSELLKELKNVIDLDQSVHFTEQQQGFFQICQSWLLCHWQIILLKEES